MKNLQDTLLLLNQKPKPSNISKMTIVIHNGTHTTIAGFSNRDLPQVVCPSSYLQRNDGTFLFGYNEMMLAEEGAVYTILDDQGVPYNWDALAAQWRWILEDQLQANPEEQALVVTVAPDISETARTQYLKLALETLKVPVFQMVLEPLAVALSLGRNTALVVDIGAAKSTVTPIVDGSVLKSAVTRSRFAGNFLDFQVNELVSAKRDASESSTVSSLDVWRDSASWIKDFKAYMLQVSPSKLQELEAMNLDVMGMNYIRNFLYKKRQTLSFTQKECCQVAEYLFQPHLASSHYPPGEGLTEIVGTAVKKAGASSSMGSSTSTNVVSPEQIHNTLLTNIVITGSTSLLPGLEQRVVNELRYQFPQYKLSSFANPLVLDRKLQSWHGGVTMANLPSWDLGEWTSRNSYKQESANGSSTK
ncbi:LAMI_0F08922g1_1 [Lachancea mirantina]|uniref:LAMI_0F08922g1_1 n=1 Tax=Lachancea mirantina TaxID=1230905 RepID=A0A1G4K0Q8_9SACH|nr:LAMI_0F08922g1_1 [Lachancea mirantina]